jgi:hypothetical protein
MSKKTTKSPSKLQNIFRGSFKNEQERGKFTSDRQKLLNDNGYNYLRGSIVQAGPNNDGTFQVQFNSGTTGYSDTWPKWAYEAARDALLHGRQVLVIHTGDIVYGTNLVGVIIQDTPA